MNTYHKTERFKKSWLEHYFDDIPHALMRANALFKWLHHCILSSFVSADNKCLKKRYFTLYNIQQLTVLLVWVYYNPLRMAAKILLVFASQENKKERMVELVRTRDWSIRTIVMYYVDMDSKLVGLLFHTKVKFPRKI